MVNAYLEGHEARDRRVIRFVAFGLAVLLALGGLTARLFYLQIANGNQYTSLAESNRAVLQAVPASRGVIYDRAGRALVTNVPSFTVKIRPADLPFSRRPQVVARLASLIGIDAADINSAIDSNPGSRFDLVRVAQDIPRATADVILESRSDMPGVDVVVEARRQYIDGPLMSQILGYTGPINAEQLAAQ
jgi:penicillin-binding protein 2